MIKNLLGITTNFRSRIVICGWHLQKNLISRFSKLKSQDAQLYNKIINLPFTLSGEKFLNILGEIKDSDIVTDSQKEYLNMKLKSRGMWAKCILKSNFTEGISTTFRIEGLHANQKKIHDF